MKPQYSSQDEEVVQAANRCAVCAVASFTLSYKEEERDRVSAMGMFFSSHSFSRLFLTCEEHTARKAEWTTSRRRNRSSTYGFKTTGSE